MNNYTTKRIPNSISGVVLIPTAVGMALVTLSPSTGIDHIENNTAYETYSISSSYFNSESYSISSIDTREEFTEILSSFYGKLAKEQEPLGDKFLKILNENIWDLYES